MADSKDYRVGYKKPPASGQFQPGRSGNPAGRPAGAKNISTVLEKELNSRIPVTENGRRKTISKRQAIVKQLVNKSVAGDPRAIPLLFGEMRQAAKVSGTAPIPETTLEPEDQLVLENIIRRIRLADPKVQTSHNSDAPSGDNGEKD